MTAQSGGENDGGLRQCIDSAIKSLRWKILYDKSPSDCPEIRSDKFLRQHTIYLLPGQAFDLGYLHELGHAWLGENINPMFSTMDAVIGTTDEQGNEVLPAYRAAGDWFVDAWMYERLPQVVADDMHYIATDFITIARQRKLSLRERLVGTETIAFLRHHRKSEVYRLFLDAMEEETSAIQGTGRMGLKRLVEAYCEVPPVPATVENLERLMNSLLTVTNPRYQVKLVHDNHDVDCWQVIEGGR